MSLTPCSSNVKTETSLLIETFLSLPHITIIYSMIKTVHPLHLNSTEANISQIKDDLNPVDERRSNGSLRSDWRCNTQLSQGLVGAGFVLRNVYTLLDNQVESTWNATLPLVDMTSSSEISNASKSGVGFMLTQCAPPILGHRFRARYWLWNFVPAWAIFQWYNAMHPRKYKDTFYE